MVRRELLIGLIAALPLGCHHRCCRPGGVEPRPFHPQPPAGSTIPPAGIPLGPSGASVVPPIGPTPAPFVLPPARPADIPPPELGSPREGNFRPAPPPSVPGKPAPEVLLPDPLPSNSPSKSQYPAPAPGPSSGVLGGPVKPPASPEPPIAKTPAGTPPSSPEPPAQMPGLSPTAGLPGFAPAKTGIASGRKPSLDGLDALKRSGYRTVVYLHPAGADLSTTREAVEKKGLAFVPIETTPDNLAAALERFNKAIGDKTAHPLYVADDDGVRAGSIWYLHFRTVDILHDDAARVRARPLGLTDTGGKATEFWLAIQQLLANR